MSIQKLCKTLRHVHQFHAHFITSGGPNQNTFLADILFAITSITPSPTAATHPLSSTSVVVRYANLVFSLITNPSTFCFNTIVRVYTLHAPSLSPHRFFVQMRRRSVPPDFHTFPFVFKAACATKKKNVSFALVEALHCQALRFGLLSDSFALNTLIRAYSASSSIDSALKLFDENPQRDVVAYNVLIDGLVKAREVARARELFDSMPHRDLVSWNSLIAGYAQMSCCGEAIGLFDEMVACGFRPDNVAIVSTLSACARSGDLEKGRAIHDYVKRNGLFVDSFLATGLVDFYAKCGFIETAMEIYSLCSDKTLFTWNAMITGLAMHGYGELTVDYFRTMISSGVRPDGVSFISVLVGCSHAGLVDEAKKLFDEMGSLYDVDREMKHYGCMADLLGRAGLIEEAAEMIEKMPGDGGGKRERLLAWSGLLGGCRIHGNIEVAEKAAERVMELSPEDGGVYKVMVEMYANAERWEDVVKVRQVMERDERVNKSAGFSRVMS